MNWLKEVISRIGLLSFAMFFVVLPPRPEAPAPQPVQSAAIELHVMGISAEIHSPWTQVQWLAGDGTWVTVEGWQGTLTVNRSDASGTQDWAVGSELYSQANFRWQLLDGEGGSVIATSALFALPSRDGQLVTVVLTME